MIFNYKEAFQRNLGLITEEEQQRLKKFTIAIPGMGGVGGAHAIAFVRLGFQNFKIADPDAFEIKNFNRQFGAKVSTIGRQKVEVMQEDMLAINPDCKIETFKNGINEANVDQFLAGVDLAVDGIDAFEVDVRRVFFNKALQKKIPVITAGPLGFGTAYLIFQPEGPTFDEYFAVSNNTPPMKKLLSFFVGLAPALLQLKYMERINLEEKRGPSSAGAVFLCAGVVAITAVKILLKKGKVKAVPYYHQFDVMRNKYVVRKLWFGNHNPIQKLKIALGGRLVKDK